MKIGELISLHLIIERFKYPPVFNKDRKYFLWLIYIHFCKSHWTLEINLLSVIRNTQTKKKKNTQERESLARMPYPSSYKHLFQLFWMEWYNYLAKSTFLSGLVSICLSLHLIKPCTSCVLSNFLFSSFFSHVDCLAPAKPSTTPNRYNFVFFSWLSMVLYCLQNWMRTLQALQVLSSIYLIFNLRHTA